MWRKIPPPPQWKPPLFCFSCRMRHCHGVWCYASLCMIRNCLVFPYYLLCLFAQCVWSLHLPDLPLILILSVYTDFLPSEFFQILIFFLKFWQNTYFFLGMRKDFLYIFLSHTDIFPKILIFLVIHTDLLPDQSGRSDLPVELAHGTKVTANSDSNPVWHGAGWVFPFSWDWERRRVVREEEEGGGG